MFVGLWVIYSVDHGKIAEKERGSMGFGTLWDSGTETGDHRRCGFFVMILALIQPAIWVFMQFEMKKIREQNNGKLPSGLNPTVEPSIARWAHRFGGVVTVFFAMGTCWLGQSAIGYL